MQHNAGSIDNGFNTGLSFATGVRFHSLNGFRKQCLLRDFLIGPNQVANLCRNRTSDARQSSESNQIAQLTRGVSTQQRVDRRHISEAGTFAFRHRASETRGYHNPPWSAPTLRPLNINERIPKRGQGTALQRGNKRFDTSLSNPIDCRSRVQSTTQNPALLFPRPGDSIPWDYAKTNCSDQNCRYRPRTSTPLARTNRRPTNNCHDSRKTSAGCESSLT